MYIELSVPLGRVSRWMRYGACPHLVVDFVHARTEKRHGLANGMAMYRDARHCDAVDYELILVLRSVAVLRTSNGIALYSIPLHHITVQHVV